MILHPGRILISHPYKAWTERADSSPDQARIHQGRSAVMCSPQSVLMIMQMDEKSTMSCFVFCYRHFQIQLRVLYTTSWVSHQLDITWHDYPLCDEFRLSTPHNII